MSSPDLLKFNLRLIGLSCVYLSAVSTIFAFSIVVIKEKMGRAVTLCMTLGLASSLIMLAVLLVWLQKLLVLRSISPSKPGLQAPESANSELPDAVRAEQQQNLAPLPPDQDSKVDMAKDQEITSLKTALLNAQVELQHAKGSLDYLRETNDQLRQDNALMANIVAASDAADIEVKRLQKLVAERDSAIAAQRTDLVRLPFVQAALAELEAKYRVLEQTQLGMQTAHNRTIEASNEKAKNLEGLIASQEKQIAMLKAQLDNDNVDSVINSVNAQSSDHGVKLH